MKRFGLFLLPLLFCYSGCIDIVEEITINPDQSGTVSFRMDMGELGGMAMDMGEKYVQGSLIKQIKNLPETVAGMLKGIDGLSNIKPVTNKKGLYSISFDFKNSKQLNAAIYKLVDLKKRSFEPSYIRINKRRMIKKNYAPVLRLFIDKYKDQLTDKSILKLIYYKTIFHFPSEVRKFSNNKSILSSDKKTLEYKCNLDELLNTNVDIGNKVKY
ncbi:MAG: hypothetical protein ABR968_00565 [Bacteroidales bacterium]